MITQEIVSELLSYDPESGQFHWKKRVSCRVPAGAMAGSQRGDQYRQIQLLGKNYGAHRLAWLLTTGQWPKGEIDHINGDKLDNRIANLRAVTRAENEHAKFSPQAGNRVGLRGVCRCNGKYQAQIQLGKRKIYLGIFDTPGEAHAAYLAAKDELQPTSLVSKPFFMDGAR